MSRFRFLILPVLLSLFAPASGDGIMESPPARNWYCGYTTKPDHLVNKIAKYEVCSTAFAAKPDLGYRFMSVESKTEGRAKVTPLPAHVCSFDSPLLGSVQTPWDVPMDWPTTPLTSGPLSITWNAYWGAHWDDTRDFSYWITKPGFVFSTTRELTWDDFEETPFCTEIYDDKNPTANPDIVADKANVKFTTKCQVPARTGRHVIYGEWGRRESTYQRFHGCIDAVFGATSIGEGAFFRRPAPGGAPAQRVDALGRRARSGAAGDADGTGGAGARGAQPAKTPLVKAP